MDPADFAPYIGSYRLDPDRTLLFTNTLSGQAGYHYFEDDRLVAIFPVSETEFVSELGEVFQFDLASVMQPFMLSCQTVRGMLVGETMPIAKSR